MSTIAEVIGWKFNNQPGMSTRGGVITEFPRGIPSQADQDLWTVEYEEYLAATQYQTDRVNGTEEEPLCYASLTEQLDMQYWDQVNGTTTFKDHIEAIKAAHPKP